MCPAVFSCGLGVHLCTCSSFYQAQRFWRLWFIAFLLGFSLVFFEIFLEYCFHSDRSSLCSQKVLPVFQFSLRFLWVLLRRFGLFFVRIELARGVPSLIGMAHTRSTYNSLTAGVIATTCTCTTSPTSSAATTTVTAAPAGMASSLSNEIASAIAQAFSHSLPTIITAIRDNTAPVSSESLAVSTSVCSSSAIVVAGSLAASSGTLRLPAFVSTFPSVSATSDSNSARPVLSFASPVMATHVSSASTYLGSSLFPPSVDKAICGWSRTRANSRQTCLEDYERSVCGPRRLTVSKSADGRAGASNISRWQAGGFLKSVGRLKSKTS